MSNEINSDQPTENNVVKTFPIVAIGASAGGLDALIQFFTPIPAKNNMAFVVITHMDPEHKSMMPELLQQHTSMHVVLISQGSMILPNTIYVIPPNKNIMIKNDTLLLVVPGESHYENLPINYFFHSLAEAYGQQAIAVVLSGCGTDGSLGIHDIKQQGGIVVVQDPETTHYSSMPQSAINTGLVDYVATSEKIYHHIKRLIKLNHKAPGHSGNAMQQIFSILRTVTGHDFAGYKINVMKRRIERQMLRLHMNVIADYVHFLRLNSNEAAHLFTDLLIGVTSFFRDTNAFITLKNTIIPQLLKNKPNHYTFRAWVPGCSSGEEAYSLAILLSEYMNETNRFFPVQIFGTDIDAGTLDIARAGVYQNTICEEMSADRLSTWFIKDKETYRVKKEIRNMVVFGIQNLIQDPPFTKIDLISCRNLLIYLNTTTQRRLFPLFHYSLKPKGVLFLGKSESASQYTDLFNSIGANYRFFEKNELIPSGYSYSNHPIHQRLLQLHKLTPKHAFKINKPQVDLEAELNLTKENLQATIEELAASNEEMQSTNEEFQSINEELETSKEELESVNEELLIVNAELQNRIEQLAAANDDMNNLFNSTNVAAIFLDNFLLIKRFTPQAQELVHIISTDIGRSFKHFSTQLKNAHLIESSEEVLKTLSSQTFEAQSNDDRWYLINVLPYRTVMNMVDGVVITFVDITQTKLDKQEILTLQSQLNAMK